MRGDGFQHAFFGVLIEVDQHIAAEDDVEHAERAQVAQQVEFAKLRHGAQRVGDAPVGLLLAEIAHQHLHGQAALDLELRVQAFLRAGQLFARDVGADDVDLTRAQRGLAFRQDHRQRVGFLAGRRGRRPDAQPDTRPPRGDQPRQSLGAKMLERLVVAKEEAFIRGHRFDDVARQRVGTRAAQAFGQGIQVRQFFTPQDGGQSGFQQIGLVLADHQAGACLQQLRERFKGVDSQNRAHDQLALSICSNFGAMSPRGSTAWHSPAVAMAPGMPQTTLVASSWAIAQPPASITARVPLSPS